MLGSVWGLKVFGCGPGIEVLLAAFVSILRSCPAAWGRSLEFRGGCGDTSIARGFCVAADVLARAFQAVSSIHCF